MKKNNGFWGMAAVSVAVAALALVVLLLTDRSSAQAGGAWPATKVALAQAERIAAPRALRGVGALEAARQVSLAAEVSGRVTRIAFESGQSVKAGQLLVQINDAPEQAERLRLQAQLRNAETVLARTRVLRADKVATQEQLDNATAARDMARGELRRVEAVIAQKAVRAPFDGVVGIRRIHEGQYLNAGDAIASLVDARTMHVNFSLDEQAVRHLHVGQPVALQLDAWPDQAFEARITAIDPMIGESRTVQVQASLPNETGVLRAGMFAGIQVQRPQPEVVLAVPETAVTYSAYGQTVFVARSEEDKGLIVRRVSVKTGERWDGRVEVESGLAEGDQVVVSGQIKLSDGMQVEAVANDALRDAGQPGSAAAGTAEGAGGMKFTDVFVRRPVLALVVSCLIVLLGLFALGKLPIRQYPLLESSTVTVSTEYPGASAELMQGFVTQPIAQAVSSVEGIDYLSSSSMQGRSVVTLRMELNRDSTRALTETMAKINQVRYRLPDQAYDPVVELSAGDSTAVAYVGFSSDSLSTPELTDYLSRVVEPLFSGIDGVAKVQTFGGQKLAMRLWLDSEKLAGRGLTASDVADAVRRNNYQAAPGQVRGQYVVSNVRVNTDLGSVEEFRDLVIRNDGNGLVRLRDVGTVELGAAATETSARMDSVNAVHLGLFSTPAGNPLVIVDGIRQLLPEIEKTLPPGVHVELAFETARFIEASISEVMHTLLEAVLIVVVVIWLCLGSLRSVVIPVVAIPLSMLGAAGLMLAFGFSINLLTLLAMVLAIGLVVDDAIVVVENVHRHIEEGKSPVAAALVGAREIAGPVVAMTLTLAAVYAPIGLMGGLTGALFREFALTLAGAVIVSGVVALTLSPVMSSLLLPAGQQDGRLARMAEHVFSGLARRYGFVLAFSLRQRWLSGGFALLVCLALPFLYQMPQRELAPAEDQAAVLTAIQAPQHASLEYAERFAEKLEGVMLGIPETTGTWIINGTDGPSSSFGGINLSLWGDRERSAAQVQADLQQAVSNVEGSSIFVFQLAPLPGSSGGLPVQMVLRSAQDYPVLYQTMEELKQRARASGLFVVVDSDLEYNNPVTQVRIDRAKAASLGIRMQDIGDSLGVLLGENYLNRFGLQGRSYDVIPQSVREQRLTPQALARQYVRTEQGTLVPLSTVVTLEMAVEPNRLPQFDQQNAATLQAIPAPGVSLGQAVAFLEQAAAELPPGFSHDWQSESRQYVHEGNALLFAFLAALVVIYLVLAAQYESLVDPLIILITVPLSICGALLPLALGWATLNIYTQIGLVTLIGLISKHGILMVEFANELQVREQLDRSTAIVRAAKIRLRPVLMTTAAMAFGVVPLLFASGAGANSRFGLGVVIVCGMLIGTVFTLFVLPTIYTLLARDHRVQTVRSRQLIEAEKALEA